MKLSRVFFIISLILVAIGTILLVCAFATAFDPSKSNYFSNGAPLPVFAGVLLALAFGCGIAGTVVAAKKDAEALAEPYVPTRILLPASLGALASSIWLMVAGKGLLGVLVLVASVFFAVEFSTASVQFPSAVLWAGFAAIAATVVWNATFYFDMSLEMNAPVKLLLQMALLSVMLLVTAECRILLGKFHRIFITALFIFGAVLCIPSGAAGFYLLLAKKGVGTAYLAAAPFLLGVGGTACLRLLKMAMPEKKALTPACSENSAESEDAEAK